MKLRTVLLASILMVVVATVAAAGSQIVLERGKQAELNGDYSGVVDLAIDPGVENAKVAVLVDGQKVAGELLSPYHLVVDFGPTALQHKITVQVTTATGKRIQWHETINRG